MKHLLWCGLFLAFISCKSKNAQADRDTNPIQEERALKAEILATDSINVELDEVNSEIKASSEELDKLLNEL